MASTAEKQHNSNSANTYSLTGAALAATAAFLLIALLFLPSSGVLILSLTDYQFGMPDFNFSGLDNYSAMPPIFSSTSIVLLLIVNVLLVLSPVA